MRHRVLLLLIWLIATVHLPLAPARAGETTVAVASNFISVLEPLAEDFQLMTGNTLIVISGSTGKMFAQIMNGAPIDVLLAADQERPEKLIELDVGMAESRFTYAIGRLVLWSPDPGLIYGPDILNTDGFSFLAIANPELAPYGKAAQQALQSLKSWPLVEDKIVRGENISQTFAMVATGNADLGFVAASLLNDVKYRDVGSRWMVPEELHEPIRQDAVLLAYGMQNPTAREFLAYLKTDRAKTIIHKHGYGAE
ncbi:MAG: molybdate ABC transporter substrate-binding protein [Magnetospiraceae bacterium]